jgi:SAM-dependent methyltransferase
MSAAAQFDANAFKQSIREQWNRSASGWNDSSAIIRPWLRTATDAMLDMAGIRAGSRVLDVAAGAGDQTLDIAARVGPGGHVLATDLSPEILAFAERNAARAGYANVAVRPADGESLPIDEGSFDAVVCRLGLMFFPDPLAGLRGMWRALEPGGGICTMVFSTPEANPCVALLVGTALQHAGLPPRDPYQPGSLFSLGRPGLIDALFAQAGFREIATTRISAPFRLPSARDYLDFIRSSASPIQQILGRLDDRARAAAWADMERKLERFSTPTGWQGPNELLLTAARR